MVLHCWPHCIIFFFIWFQVIAATASQGNERRLVNIWWSISWRHLVSWVSAFTFILIRVAEQDGEWIIRAPYHLSLPAVLFRPCTLLFSAWTVPVRLPYCTGFALMSFVNTVPTKGFNTEKIKVTLGGKGRTATFHFWDVGGQEKLRPLWRSYTRCADGLVFVVDSVDAERMEEAKTELHKITRLQENQGVPVLVVANKQDLRSALPLGEVEQMLALNELGSHTPWHLQPACAIIGEGLEEGLECLHSMIIKRKKMMRQQKRKRWLFGDGMWSGCGGRPQWWLGWWWAVVALRSWYYCFGRLSFISQMVLG